MSLAIDSWYITWREQLRKAKLMLGARFPTINTTYDYHAIASYLRATAWPLGLEELIAEAALGVCGRQKDAQHVVEVVHRVAAEQGQDHLLSQWIVSLFRCIVI